MGSHTGWPTQKDPEKEDRGHRPVQLGYTTRLRLNSIPQIKQVRRML